jgi:hypothetical protein
MTGPADRHLRTDRQGRQMALGRGCTGLPSASRAGDGMGLWEQDGPSESAALHCTALEGRGGPDRLKAQDWTG